MIWEFSTHNYDFQQRMEHNDMCLRIFPSSQFSLFCLIPPELLTGQTSWLLLAADTTTHTYFPIRWILLQTSGESQSSACKNSLHNDFDEVCVTVWCVMWHRGMWVWHRVTESVTGMLWLWSHRTHLTKQLSYKGLIDVQNNLRCQIKESSIWPNVFYSFTWKGI